MKNLSLILFATLFSLGTTAYPFPRPSTSTSTSTGHIESTANKWAYELHESRPHHTDANYSWEEEADEWRLAGRAPRRSVIPVEIQLSPSAAGGRAEGRRSPPNHSQYTLEGNQGKPRHHHQASAALESVTAWLHAYDIESARLDLTRSTTIRFNATIAEMESLLRTEYALYEHVHSGRIYLGVEEYSLPAALRDEVIRGVEPTIGMFL
jgi:hypothetical protein